MRERRGLGGLADIFGENKKKSKTNDLSMDNKTIGDLIKKETLFKSSNEPSE